MKIEVFGAGCSKCEELYHLTKLILSELQMDVEVEKVTEVTDWIAAKVFKTPALRINGAVVVSGRVPSQEEIKELILHYSKKD